MKTKRSGYLQNPSPLAKKKQLAAATVASTSDTEPEKKEQTECSKGVCTVVWKPAALSR